MMANYAVIEDGLVINIVVWDGDPATWAPPESVTTVNINELTNVGIGSSYANDIFTAPPLAQTQI